ncbi:DUF1934 domain-containing protein [Lentilactobacillus laojiaonis]|uniref:DUF1934 domain-containing protein n=1 Tax=Lentilactobacillus laojiaonis TaxID=2883998 RepID=UPI001D0A8962|nr:DUF1934 domain-containing protein [Lentilactobacillus laojiaonis]UDM31934.1 DUF1934 domain-containing protein [Lentilactobacillus laojiaonis]
MNNISNGTTVQIHLETTIKQDQSNEHFVFDTVGQLVEIGDNIYIRYVEENQDEGDIPVTLKIMKDGSVKITRSSQSRLQLVLQNQKKVSSQYKTPYGILGIDTLTTNLDIKILENPLRGNVNADYMLYNGQELLGNYNIRLQFTI